MLATTLMIFLVLKVLPGDPALVMLGPEAQPDTAQALRHELGLDRAPPLRFAGWVGDVAAGDLGVSYIYKVPVRDLVRDRLAITLPLAVLAMTMTIVIAISLGVYAAANHNTARDQGVMAFTQIGIAIPSFWFGLLLVLFFAVRLGWFPAGGFPGWRIDPIGSMRALILPATALAVVQAAILARLTRAALLEVLREDFGRTARSKGLNRRQVLWRHALRNALIPIMTVMGLQFAQLIAGTIVIENVFALPGVGRLLFQAVAQRDLIVVRGVVLLIAGLVVLVNFAVDLTYLAIDPRLRTAK